MVIPAICSDVGEMLSREHAQLTCSPAFSTHESGLVNVEVMKKIASGASKKLFMAWPILKCFLRPCYVCCGRTHRFSCFQRWWCHHSSSLSITNWAWRPNSWLLVTAQNVSKDYVDHISACKTIHYWWNINAIKPQFSIFAFAFGRRSLWNWQLVWIYQHSLCWRSSPAATRQWSTYVWGTHQQTCSNMPRLHDVCKYMERKKQLCMMSSQSMSTKKHSRSSVKCCRKFGKDVSRSKQSHCCKAESSVLQCLQSTKNCKILHSHLYAYFQLSVRVLISTMRCWVNCQVHLPRTARYCTVTCMPISNQACVCWFQ